MTVEPLNDSTYRFQFETPISEDEFTITSARHAAFSPLGKKLFGFPWVEELKISPQSVDLTKKDWVDWDILLEPLKGLLEEHFSTNSVLEKSAAMPSTSEQSAESEQIKEFIQNSVNPSLAMHGGFVELRSFDNSTAYLKMGGGCQGCASSQMTMIEGIQTALREHFPFVQRVVDVTDHASGANPYM